MVTICCDSSANHDQIGAPWDSYCHRSMAATALSVATLGVGRAVGPTGKLLEGTDSEALTKIARFVLAENVSFGGPVGGSLIDTTQRQKGC